MNVIYVDKESYDYLNTWAKDNRRLLFVCADYSKYYFKKSKIIFKEHEIFTYNEVRRDYVSVTVHDLADKKSFAKIRLRYTPDADNDYEIAFDISKEYKRKYGYDIVSQFVQIVCTAFINFNAFITYGNITEDKQVIITGKSDGDDKVFTMRKFEDRLYCIQTTAHRSPEGIFSVRGHFRKYKSGKIIWIDEYLKGTNHD